jgi:hypothetical protein
MSLLAPASRRTVTTALSGGQRSKQEGTYHTRTLPPCTCPPAPCSTWGSFCTRLHHGHANISATVVIQFAAYKGNKSRGGMPGRWAPTILALGHHALVRRLLAVLGIVLALACIMTNQVSVSATGHGRQHAALRAMSQGGGCQVSGHPPYSHLATMHLSSGSLQYLG